MTRSPIFLVAVATAIACSGARQGEPGTTPTSPGTTPSAAPEPSTVSDAPSAPAVSAVPSAPSTTSEAQSGAAPVAAGGAPGASPEAATVVVGDAQVTGGTLPNLEDVIGSFRKSFATCVARGRAQRPDAEGQISLTIRVGTAGQVLGVAAQQTTKIPASLVSCLSTRAATAQFAPPQGAKSQVSVLVPVTVPAP